MLKSLYRGILWLLKWLFRYKVVVPGALVNIAMVRGFIFVMLGGTAIYRFPPIVIAYVLLVELLITVLIEFTIKAMAFNSTRNALEQFGYSYQEYLDSLKLDELVHDEPRAPYSAPVESSEKTRAPVWLQDFLRWLGLESDSSR